MKTTLKRLGDGDYKLYNTDGSCMATTKESPYKKLSVKNCDDIFGVVDVDNLQQPTEIEVEIEMRPASLVYKTDDVIPKLDENGCVILIKK
jgi:hypothetical protein